MASVVAGLAVLAWAGVGSTFGAFSATTADGGNTFSAAPDFVAPTISTTVIAKAAGGTPGYIRQGGSYRVYANVSDTGNPPSGISTVRANVSTITTGATAVTLTAGSFNVGGVSYNYRSASRTANNPLAEGTFTYSITSTDIGANTGTQTGFTVTVENTAPAGSDVQTNNGGSIVGRPEQGDVVTYTYAETMDPDSILAGWTGASTSVVVRIKNNLVGGNDVVRVRDSTNSLLLPLGDLDLGRNDYVTADRDFTASTMVQSGATITITLGPPSGAVTTAAGTGTIAWTPSATATDPAGNPCSTAAVNESGGADAEF
jgi:hypothetical protein